MPYSDWSVRVCVCPSVRPVRKKWLRSFCSTVNVEIKIKPIYLYEGIRSSIVKISPTWNVLPTFSWNFPPAKITTFTVTIGATFTKLAPTVHLDMIYWYHVVVCVLDLYFTFEWPWLGRNDYVYITVPMGATFTTLAPTVHLHMIYWCQMVVCVLDLHLMLEWPGLGRNG